MQQKHIVDSQVKTLQQFFLLSYMYRLSKTGLKNAGSSYGMRVMMK